MPDLGGQSFYQAKVREAWSVLVLSLLRLIVWRAATSELPMNTMIQSVGAPPERHADRVVAEASQFEVRMNYDDIIAALTKIAPAEPRAAALLAFAMNGSAKPSDITALREQFGLPDMFSAFPFWLT
jgi:hypothetical protein